MSWTRDMGDFNACHLRFGTISYYYRYEKQALFLDICPEFEQSCEVSELVMQTKYVEYDLERQ